MNGFNDYKAVEAHLKHSRHSTRSATDDKIKVALGTLRTKVFVHESKCSG